MSADQLASITEAVTASLNTIAPLFNPEARITLVVRMPGEENTAFVLSNDDILAVSAELLIRSAADAAVDN